MHNTLTVCLRSAPGVELPFSLGKLLHVLNDYLDAFLGPFWGVAAQVVEEPDRAEAYLSIVDDQDQCDCLGWHEVSPSGVANGFVSVADCARSGQAVSVVASHELAELVVDPGANLAALSPRGRWIALEVCDPVQGDVFDFEGLDVCNLVTPAWFGDPRGGMLDVCGMCNEPWEIRPGGYVLASQGGKWASLFGSQERRLQFAREDRRRHRTERRHRQSTPSTLTTTVTRQA